MVSAPAGALVRLQTADSVASRLLATEDLHALLAVAADVLPAQHLDPEDYVLKSIICGRGHNVGDIKGLEFLWHKFGRLPLRQMLRQ